MKRGITLKKKNIAHHEVLYGEGEGFLTREEGISSLSDCASTKFQF